MNLREKTENLEINNLSKLSQKSKFSKGRNKPEEKCTIRTDFQKDRDRILHSKAFRRLMHKTQVFISPEHDHFRTRLTHTLEVSQISRTISRALSLNEDLTEAIALGHDLGHTPFGHSGEDVLNSLSEKGFEHNKHSIRVVEKLERNGEGLNLTKEVLDGILNHPSKGTPSTLEGKVVQISDKIAYINHDIEDSIGAGVISEIDLPKEYINILGKTSSERINFLITDLIKNSQNVNDIFLNENVKHALYGLREFMFNNVYYSKDKKDEEEKIKHLLKEIYYFYFENPNKLSVELFENINSENSKSDVIIDYIAGMTDRYAIKVYGNLFIPNNFDISF